MNIHFISPFINNKYDKGLFYQIFNKGEYSDILPYMKNIHTFFDIGAYKGFFSLWLLENGYKNNLFLVEPVKDYLNLAQIIINKFVALNNIQLKNKIKFINAALISKYTPITNFIIDLNKPGHSRFDVLIQDRKILKFFKTFSYKTISNIKTITIENLLKLGKGPIAVKLDIEGQEIPLLLQNHWLNKIYLLVFEYHLFNKELENNFKKILQILKSHFSKIILKPSPFSPKIGLVIATKN